MFRSQQREALLDLSLPTPSCFFLPLSLPSPQNASSTAPLQPHSLIHCPVVGVTKWHCTGTEPMLVQHHLALTLYWCWTSKSLWWWSASSMAIGFWPKSLLDSGSLTFQSYEPLTVVATVALLLICCCNGLVKAWTSPPWTPGCSNSGKMIMEASCGENRWRGEEDLGV